MTVTRHHSLTHEELLRLVNHQLGNELVVELGKRLAAAIDRETDAETQKAEISLLQERVADLTERAENAESALTFLS